MWTQIILFVASLVISYALRPKPQNIPPAGMGEINAPTASVGREIPVLFGTRKLQGPNVVWYGDLRTSAVKKKGGKK